MTPKESSVIQNGAGQWCIISVIIKRRQQKVEFFSLLYKQLPVAAVNEAYAGPTLQDNEILGAIRLYW